MQTPLTVAAGAYLRRLRERKGLTRAQIEQAIQAEFSAAVSGSTIRQIEDGKVRDGAKLAMVNFVLRGELRYLDGLLRLPTAPAAYGAALAEAQLATTEARGGATAPSAIRAIAILLAVYEDAVADRDLESQRQALATLADHFRQPAGPSPEPE